MTEHATANGGQPTAELAHRDTEQKAVSVSVPLTGPMTLDQAWRYAVALARSDLLPPALRGKPANVLLAMLYGQYLGVPPALSPFAIPIVHGRPMVEGKLLLAKVREAGHRPVVQHAEDGQSCTVTITRGDTGEQHTETFHVEDAVRAGLCTRNEDGTVRARSAKGEPLPWETYTRRMLMWRALGWCVDVICPELKLGFLVEGELPSEEPDAAPTLAQVAAERLDQHTAATQLDPAAVAAQVAGIERQFLNPNPNQDDLDPQEVDPQ